MCALANIVILFLCLGLGALLRHYQRLPENAHQALNGFVFNISLPALVLTQVHGIAYQPEFTLAVAMPWLLFALGCAFFWCVSKLFQLDERTTGALMLAGGLANTSFVGLPMIEAFYGRDYLAIGILIDQLGTYLVLSTLGILIAAWYNHEEISVRNISRQVVTFPPLVALVLAMALWRVPFPDWLDDVLHRLGATLVPLALVSVGMQLHLEAFKGNMRALCAGLGYKLVLGPAAIAGLYLMALDAEGQIIRVTVFEAAMGPQIGGAIVAAQHGLNPTLVSLMVGLGITLSFITLPLWFALLRAA